VRKHPTTRGKSSNTWPPPTSKGLMAAPYPYQGKAFLRRFYIL